MEQEQDLPTLLLIDGSTEMILFHTESSSPFTISMVWLPLLGNYILTTTVQIVYMTYEFYEMVENSNLSLFLNFGTDLFPKQSVFVS